MASSPWGICLKLFAALPIAALITTTLTAVPATASTLLDPAPSNVRISWKDDTFQHVRVTWEEDEPRPNVIVLRHRGGQARYLPVYLAADAPNAVDVPAVSVRDLAWTEGGTPLEFEVAVGTSAGTTSPIAVTEAFDASAPLPASVVSTAMSGASTLTVRWAPAAAPADETPGDPLDRTVPLTYQASYRLSETGQETQLGQRSAATQVTFTSPKPSFHFSVTVFNEWGGQYPGAGVDAEGAKLTANVPAWAVYQAGSPKITGTYSPVEQPRQVILQARNSPTSPWYVVATDAFTGGKYAFPLGTGGSRQYRVVVPNASYHGGVTLSYGAYTAPASSTTQLRATAAFRWTQVRVGTTNEARLTVGPGVTTTATLQRWNGATWTTVGPVAVRNGQGTGYIRTVTPGRTAYRYYVPASTFGGASFAAAYTATFVNVVVN
jgi:hypothetical protein